MTDIDNTIKNIASLHPNKIAKHYSAADIAKIITSLQCIALKGCELAKDVATLNPKAGEIGEGKCRSLIEKASKVSVGGLL